MWERVRVRGNFSPASGGTGFAGGGAAMKGYEGKSFI